MNFNSERFDDQPKKPFRDSRGKYVLTTKVLPRKLY